MEEDLGSVTQLGVFVREGVGVVVAEERRRIVTCEYCYCSD